MFSTSHINQNTNEQMSTNEWTPSLDHRQLANLKVWPLNSFGMMKLINLNSPINSGKCLETDKNYKYQLDSVRFPSNFI